MILADWGLANRSLEYLNDHRTFNTTLDYYTGGTNRRFGTYGGAAHGYSGFAQEWQPHGPVFIMLWNQERYVITSTWTHRTYWGVGDCALAPGHRKERDWIEEGICDSSAPVGSSTSQYACVNGDRADVLSWNLVSGPAKRTDQIHLKLDWFPQFPRAIRYIVNIGWQSQCRVDIIH